jgi:hypothetical protein
MIFAKKLILSSVFAIGAFGLIACGSDSKSSTEAGPDQQGDKIVVPDKKDPNITVTEFSSRIAGDEIRFKGQFGLDFVGDPDAQDSVFNTVFTGIDYKVGKGTDASNMVNVGVTISSNQILFPTQNSIDLNSMNSAYVSVNLTDPAFTECGTYSLVVTVTANDGEKDYQRTEIIPFERDAAEYCRTEDTTSQQPVKAEVAMTSCQVELSTNVNPGLSLATCTAAPAGSPADIIFSKAKVDGNPELSATSTTVSLAPITNGDLPPYTDDYEVDMWPEDMNADRSPATAYVSDFKFKTPGNALSLMIENSNQIYVALAPGYSTETGVGFYAFAITETTEGNNGDYTFKVKLYRVQ